VLDGELMLVSDVLITASAAAAKVWAFRRDALLDRRENFCELRFGELFLLAHDLRGDALTLDRERDEDRLAIRAADAFAAEGDVVDVQLDRLHSAEL
jgi:hypothetical protein